MWSYIENVLDKEPKKEVNPKNNILDENQDNVMNINFGLSDYGRLKYMLEMAGLLKKKKMFEKMLSEEGAD